MKIKVHQEFEVKKSLKILKVEILKKEIQVIFNLERVKSKIHHIINNFNFYLQII